MSSSSFIYRHHSPAQGFTLVELLVTVTILAILLAVGVPNLTQMLQDKAAASSAEAFASDIRLARTEAIKRGIPIELCGVSITIANNKTTYSCLPASQPDWTSNGWMLPNPNDAEHPIKVQDMPTGAGSLQVSSLGTNNSFRFNPTGIWAGGTFGGNATISPRGNTASVRTVVVSSTGKTRITKGTQS
jgi:type IV fimbrial biogenesis protein FimT